MLSSVVITFSKLEPSGLPTQIPRLPCIAPTSAILESSGEIAAPPSVSPSLRIFPVPKATDQTSSRPFAISSLPSLNQSLGQSPAVESSSRVAPLFTCSKKIPDVSQYATTFPSLESATLLRGFSDAFCVSCRCATSRRFVGVFQKRHPNKIASPMAKTSIPARETAATRSTSPGFHRRWSKTCRLVPLLRTVSDCPLAVSRLRSQESISDLYAKTVPWTSCWRR